MSSGILADKRTVEAIRKADRLPGVLTTIKVPAPISQTATAATKIYWAKVTAVTDANNYTVSIYDRSDESTAIETSKQMRVYDIIDQLVIDDWVPVQKSNIDGEDYECIQQLGALG